MHFEEGLIIITCIKISQQTHDVTMMWL